MTDRLFVGVDGGGTKTVALAAVGDRVEHLRAGPAQALRDGPGAAADVVLGLLDEARARFPEASLGGVAVGLAGAGRAPVRDAVAAALRPVLGGAPLTVTHDADVALHAAWGAGSGALLLAGTGSLALVRDRAGGLTRAGGWGALLGDDGSGTALGRAALRAVLGAADGGPPSALVGLAAERHGLRSASDVVRAVYEEGRPLSAFAGLLLAAAGAGDAPARQALRAEAAALAGHAARAARAARSDVEGRVAVTGGLSREPVYLDALRAALAERLPGWPLTRSEAEPAEGALAMARALGA